MPVRSWLVVLSAAVFAAACSCSPSSRPERVVTSVPPPVATAPAAPAPEPASAVKSFPPLAPRIVSAAAPFKIAVARAGEGLFADGAKALGHEPRPLVVDPLIDAHTGAQTVSSVRMSKTLAAIVRAKYPMWKVEPLSREVLTESPLLVIGTLTPINSKNDTAELADAFRIWLTLIDLRTGRIAAKTLDRATRNTVDAHPTAYYRESPAWHLDKTASAYVNSSQGESVIGELMDPAYLKRLPAAAVVTEATEAYEAHRYAEAYRLYHQAKKFAEPDDLRVLNGLYLTSARLGKRKEADESFAHIVGAGLDSKRLLVNLLFAPNSTNFAGPPTLRNQYAAWLRTIADSSEERGICLQVVGHTSHTGSEEVNDKLSLERAVVVEKRLALDDRELGEHLTADGHGYRDNLIGLGTDDARDALDRRVEFRVTDCK